MQKRKAEIKKIHFALQDSNKIYTRTCDQEMLFVFIVGLNFCFQYEIKKTLKYAIPFSELFYDR